MRLSNTFVVLPLLASALAQLPTKPEARSATVPVTLDHNRVVIDVYLPLPDGSTKRVRGWVDNGDPELHLSRHAAGLMGLAVTCDEKLCTAPPPAAITIGELSIPLAGIKQVVIPLKPPSASDIMAPGMSAEINIPSTVLRNYDVLVDYPNREFTMGTPGSVKFKGLSARVTSLANGAIELPAQLENKKYKLALDLGSSISFISEDIFLRLANSHADWPHMTGAVGPANLWGSADETQWKVMRVDRMQFGLLYLTSVPVVSKTNNGAPSFDKTIDNQADGLLGAEALMNYRVGFDYAHSTVYFDLGSTFKFPDFDVIGLILRPDDDTQFTILGVAEFDGKPSVPDVQGGDHLLAVDGIPVPDSTMGQVWSLLEGTPGQERKLTLERAGKQFSVIARVQHFLGQTEEDQSQQKRGRKK